jgi:hypothetical protein
VNFSQSLELFMKRKILKRVEFGMDICARSFVVVATNVITTVVVEDEREEKCIHNISENIH